MKNTVALVALLAALTACSKPADTPAPAPAPAATPAPAASADLPKECQDYLDKVSACVSKQSGAAADAMKASMEQTKSAWAGMSADKAALGAACKAASDAFAAQATAMNC